MTETRILRPEEVIKILPESILRLQPLYNQPEFPELIKPGKLRFGQVSHKNETIFFPFTGDVFLWKWRIFQLPYCQQFSPFSTSEIQFNTESSTLWLEWLREKSYSCQWAFPQMEINPAINGIRTKTNQFLDLEKTAKEIFSSWKKGRINSLSKSSEFETIQLDHAQFKKFLENLNLTNGGRGWKPNTFEKAAILRISNSDFFGKNLKRFAVIENGMCLSLILLLEWNGRWHYLFSQSSARGFETDSLTRFFYDFLLINAGKGGVFDFEGSSLPGVHSFFQSLGAEEEHYFLFEK